jgi:hypothetical protein
LWLGVTAHRSAEWIGPSIRQLTEACGWSEPPRYIIHDRDGAYGEAFIRWHTGSPDFSFRPRELLSCWWAN